MESRFTALASVMLAMWTRPAWSAEIHPKVTSKRSTEFWITLCSAAALGAASAVTGGVALSLRGSAASKCNFDRNYCATAAGQSDASQARTLAWVSTGLLAGALVTAGVAFILPKTNVTVEITPTGSVGVHAPF